MFIETHLRPTGFEVSNFDGMHTQSFHSRSAKGLLQALSFELKVDSATRRMRVSILLMKRV